MAHEIENLYGGKGSPEGHVTAVSGSVYVDAASGTFYEKNTGNGSTGWRTIPGAAGTFAFASAPATSSDTGTAGQMAYDSNYIYICIATNTWKRVAIATW